MLKESVADEYNGETLGISSVPEMIKLLAELKESKSRKTGVLKELHKKVQDMY